MQEFFIHNGKPKWTEDYPRRVMDESGKCRKAGIYFCAVVGSMGSTGTKFHIGTAYVCEYDNGMLELESVTTGCAAGTASRGGCSGSRPAGDFSTSGIAETTCKTAHCKKMNGTNLDEKNKTPWIEVRTFYGLTPHIYHI